MGVSYRDAKKAKLPEIDRKNRIRELIKEGIPKDETIKIIDKEYPPGTLSIWGKPYKSSNANDVRTTYWELST